MRQIHGWCRLYFHDVILWFFDALYLKSPGHFLEFGLHLWKVWGTNISRMQTIATSPHHKVYRGLLQEILPKGSDFRVVNLSNSTPITLNSKSKIVSTSGWKKSLSIFECSLFQLFTRCSKATPRVWKPATWAMLFCVRLGMRARSCWARWRHWSWMENSSRFSCLHNTGAVRVWGPCALFVLGSSWNWQQKDFGGLGAWENPVYKQKSWVPDLQEFTGKQCRCRKFQRLCHDVATSTPHNSWQFPWNLVNFLPKHRKVTRLPEVDNEGCKSTLVVQTMMQLRSGVKASRMKTVGSDELARYIIA